MENDPGSLALAFLLNLVLETAVALWLGFHKRWEIACVLCVNVFSYPWLVFIVLLLARHGQGPLDVPVILLLETGVVLVEWLLLGLGLPHCSRSRLLILSLIMNSVSFLTGCLTFGVTNLHYFA
jgi:hypothetical protein